MGAGAGAGAGAGVGVGGGAPWARAPLAGAEAAGTAPWAAVSSPPGPRPATRAVPGTGTTDAL